MYKYLGFLLLIAFSSCSRKNYLIVNGSETDRCYKRYTQNYTIDTAYNYEEDSFLLKRFSKSSLVIANTYKLIDEIRAYKKIQKRLLLGKFDDKTILYKVYYENEISQRLEQANLELRGLTSSIQCEILRLAKIESDLRHANNKTQTNITNAAIMIGTVTALVTAGILFSSNDELKDGHAFDWIGVGGGLAATYLAIKSSKTEKYVKINHENNLLREVWDGDNQQGLFYPTLWYLINQNDLNSNEKGSMRDHIKESWAVVINTLMKEDNSEAIATLLSNEGDYNVELLKLRIELLSEVQNGLDILSQSYFNLNQELQRSAKDRE